MCDTHKCMNTHMYTYTTPHRTNVSTSFLPVWQHKYAWHYSISTKPNPLALSPSNGVVSYDLLILLRGTKTNNTKKKFAINI